MIAPTSSKISRHKVASSFFHARRVGRWLAFLSVSLFACSLIGHVFGRYYFLELFSHFAVQYQWLSYGFLGLWAIYGLVYRKMATLFLPGLSVALLVSTIYINQTPWVVGDYDTPIQAPTGDVRLFHANVLYAREEYVTTVAMLRQYRSDLFVLQEMTPATIRLVTDKVKNEFPYWFACYSKGGVWTLVGSRTRFQVDQALARRLRIISLTTQVRGRKVTLLTVHPRTPLVPTWFRERNKQLAYAARKARTNATPTVLIGDFNISIFSPIYKDIFRPADASSNRTTSNGQLTAARRVKTQPTWPSFFPLIKIPIDHAFVNNGFTPLLFRTIDQSGSDHRAVVVDLKIR
ncbi:endonuclease/exonuclease/phosphatase family protein [Spirosoma sp. RP8]|uniref:Endonuclease/exonuclease/phosphatase family protein n=1 Tax=Spirosoma liriopis TaxID=2937440 RepID=A0ABT0HFR7_9BACT|nr:endonuclease/exonuclease/phosphatase family protein [Spirosoma liriopis]MCK8490460.1 endonuclease/exonuclease/phosphatase family protein [Spirosoma liriopis]